MWSSTKKRYDEMVDRIELADINKEEYIRIFWIPKILEMKRKASQTKFGYYSVSLVSLIGGAIITFLATQNFSGNTSNIIHWFVFGIGLLVTVSGALATFFGFGKNMQDYYMVHQDLEKEWWNFFILQGIYAEYQTHIIAFPKFKERMENIKSKIDAIRNLRTIEEIQIPRLDRTNLPLDRVN
jgi:hypothetical protein